MMQRVFPHAWESALEIYFEEYRRGLATCPAMAPELRSALTLLNAPAVKYKSAGSRAASVTSARPASAFRQ